MQDLVGAIGGYLGLFLGWSVMSLVTSAPSWVKMVLQQFTNINKAKMTYRCNPNDRDDRDDRDDQND